MTNFNFHLEFLVLVVVLAWLAIRGIYSGKGVYEFPTLAALIGFAWVVPQGIELETSSENQYGGGAFWLYVSACYLLIAWGFHAGLQRKKKRQMATANAKIPKLDHERLLIAAFGLSVVGQLSNLMIGRIDTSNMGGEWTGVITMYSLFWSCNGMALCLAVLVFARTRWPIAIGVAAIAAMPIILSVLSGVRREQLFDLIVLTVGGWYLSRRLTPPRLAIIALLIVGTVILNKVGEIRNYVKTGQGS
ncbi:hypothetical protein, partial [Hyphomonas sp. CY54-11-8]|uniref:hypothetical protein n=1 Tax=Hyphomonas sp. CY54-11-8 TaxID=1280944 RepID=UPI000458E892